MEEYFNINSKRLYKFYNIVILDTELTAKQTIKLSNKNIFDIPKELISPQNYVCNINSNDESINGWVYTSNYFNSLRCQSFNLVANKSIHINIVYILD